MTLGVKIVKKLCDETKLMKGPIKIFIHLLYYLYYVTYIISLSPRYNFICKCK